MREWLKRVVGATHEPTTSAGWEAYARAHDGSRPLGDEWNQSHAVRIDVAPDEIVPLLDRTVFAPFLGACETIRGIMTPEPMRGFVERAGLAVEACRTDVVRRDAITFIRRT